MTVPAVLSILYEGQIIQQKLNIENGCRFKLYFKENEDD